MLLFYVLIAFSLGFWVGRRASKARPYVPVPHEWDAFGQPPARRMRASPERAGITKPGQMAVQRFQDRTFLDSPGRIYLQSAP